MGDSCKLMITQERFAGLLNNKTMEQKHETRPKTIKQWWKETHILPSELSKLGHTLCTHKKQ